MHASVRVYTMYINVLALFLLFIHAHTHVHTNSPKNQICSSTIAVLVMKILITALLPLKCIENVLLYLNCFRMCLLLVLFLFNFNSRILCDFDFGFDYYYCYYYHMLYNITHFSLECETLYFFFGRIRRTYFTTTMLHDTFVQCIHIFTRLNVLPFDIFHSDSLLLPTVILTLYTIQIRNLLWK